MVNKNCLVILRLFLLLIIVIINFFLWFWMTIHHDPFFFLISAPNIFFHLSPKGKQRGGKRLTVTNEKHMKQLNSNPQPMGTSDKRWTRDTDKGCNDRSSTAGRLTAFTAITPSKDYFLSEICSAGSRKEDDGTNSLLSHLFPLFAQLPFTQRILCERRWCVWQG